MKKIIFFQVLISIIFFQSQVKALGHETGNGGGAVVCRDSENEVLSVELLDLWEARTLGGHLVSAWAELANPAGTALEKLIRVNPLFGARVRAAINANAEIRVPVPQGVHLEPPTDAQNWLMKDHCSLESVAQYRHADSGDRLYIEEDLFKKMSSVDQAALWIHEAVYKVLRDDDGDQDSTKTRAITSRLFQPGELSEIAQTNVICFHHLNKDENNYAFVAQVNFERENLQAWVSRVDSKWQIPAIPVAISDLEKEQQFLKAFKLQVSDVKNDLAGLSVLSLPMRYNYDRKIKGLVAFLSPRIMALNGDAFSFSLSLGPQMNANCISK